MPSRGFIQSVLRTSFLHFNPIATLWAPSGFVGDRDSYARERTDLFHEIRLNQICGACASYLIIAGSKMIHLEIALVLFAILAIICSIVRSIPKSFSDLPRHVLICSAHSDDCVIMGAEYAYGA